MSDAVQIALIISAGPTLVGIVGAIVSLVNGRKLNDIHKSTNSMKDALVAAEKNVSFAEGVESTKSKHEK